MNTISGTASEMNDAGDALSGMGLFAIDASTVGVNGFAVDGAALGGIIAGGNASPQGGDVEARASGNVTALHGAGAASASWRSDGLAPIPNSSATASVAAPSGWPPWPSSPPTTRRAWSR